MAPILIAFNYMQSGCQICSSPQSFDSNKVGWQIRLELVFKVAFGGKYCPQHGKLFLRLSRPPFSPLTLDKYQASAYVPCLFRAWRARRICTLKAGAKCLQMRTFFWRLPVHSGSLFFSRLWTNLMSGLWIAGINP